MSMITHLFGRVIKIHVNGTINSYMNKNIIKQLDLTTYLPVKVVIVSINSTGGSLTQAKNLANILVNYKKQKNVALYCFAEDQCLSSSTILLTAADKCYANRMGILGGFNYIWSQLNFATFNQKYGIREKKVIVNQNKQKYSAWEPLKPQTQRFTKLQLQTLAKDLQETVLENRRNRLKRLADDEYGGDMQLLQSKIKEQVFNRPAATTELMLKYGLIDGVKNYWQLQIFPEFRVGQQFKNARIDTINRTDPIDIFRYTVENMDSYGGYDNIF